MQGSFPVKANDEFQLYIYEHFSRIGKTLSSPNRLIILNILSNGEHTVDDIAKMKNLKVSNVSRHLNMLKSNNFVKSRREGKYVFYSVIDEETKRFFQEFRSYAGHHLAELLTAMEQVGCSSSRKNSIGRKELIKAIKEDTAQIIDVRPKGEYDRAHFPKAISMPLDVLPDMLDLLDKQRLIIVYCRDMYCILADKANDFLSEHGFTVKRVDDNVVDWELEGLHLE